MISKHATAEDSNHQKKQSGILRLTVLCVKNVGCFCNNHERSNLNDQSIGLAQPAALVEVNGTINIPMFISGT